MDTVLVPPPLTCQRSLLLPCPPVNREELAPGRLQHFCVVYGALKFWEYPDLAGDGQAEVVVDGRDHLSQQLPFVLKK